MVQTVLKKKYPSLIIGLMFLLFVGTIESVCGQESNLPMPECSRKDKDKPPLFIVFERAESGNALLRLQNNTHCPILIPTNQTTDIWKAVKQPNGGFKIEQTNELKNGSLVPVVYYLINTRDSNKTVMVTEGCVVVTYRLWPQESILFTVPLKYFKKHVDIGVEFNYLWEEDGGSAISSNFIHQVFFRNESLPREIIR